MILRVFILTDRLLTSPRPVLALVVIGVCGQVNALVWAGLLLVVPHSFWMFWRLRTLVWL